MYSQKDFESINSIILENIPKVASIILFGSYARGTAKNDSDIDIAIITEQAIERSEKLKLLTSLRWKSAKLGYDIDFLLKNEKDFLSENRLPTLSNVIFKEGKVLWKK